MEVRASGECSWHSWNCDNTQRAYSTPPLNPLYLLHTPTVVWHQSSAGNRAGQSRAGCVCSMPSIPPKVISLSSVLHNQTGTAGCLYLDNRAAQSYCIHWSCHGTWIIKGRGMSSLGVKLAEYLKYKGRIHLSTIYVSHVMQLHHFWRPVQSPHQCDVTTADGIPL